LLVVVLIVVPVLLSRRKRRVELTGRLATATIVSVNLTGTYVNNLPVMKIDLDVNQPDGTQRRCSIRERIMPGTSMNPGEQRAVVVDPKNPDKVYFADSTALNRQDSTGAALRMAQSIPAAFASGPLAVGDVVGITPVGDGSSSVQVDVVNIGRPHQTVFCRQSFSGAPYFEVGDRVFLKLDGQTPPRAGHIMPLEFTKGERIPRTGNRLDALVLADEILFAGAKAQAKIESSVQQPIPDAYTQRGMSKWMLQVSIVPDDGSAPYAGTTTIAVSNPQKAATVSQVGTTIPVRYDPNDPATFTVDSIALGWGDPKLALEQAKQVAAQIHRA
jgi:hypothetical protein